MAKKKASEEETEGEEGQKETTTTSGVAGAAVAGEDRVMSQWVVFSGDPKVAGRKAGVPTELDPQLAHHYVEVVKCAEYCDPPAPTREVDREERGRGSLSNRSMTGEE